MVNIFIALKVWYYVYSKSAHSDNCKNKCGIIYMRVNLPPSPFTKVKWRNNFQGDLNFFNGFASTIFVNNNKDNVIILVTLN